VFDGFLMFTPEVSVAEPTRRFGDGVRRRSMRLAIEVDVAHQDVAQHGHSGRSDVVAVPTIRRR